MTNNGDISRITPESWLASNDKKLRFVVPVYQRLFTWENAQFDRLLADLSDWNNCTQNNEPYYLGIITVVERDRDNDYIKTYTARQTTRARATT